MKKEFKKLVEKKAKIIIKNIDSIPDEYETMGFTPTESIIYNDITLYKSIKNIEDLYDNLREIRKIEKWTIESYWIPYSHCVCTSYVTKNKAYNIRFSFECINDCQGLINILSGGKCKIVDKKTQTVTCNIK